MDEKKDVRIVVLQRGWVAVGEFSQATPDECVLTHACILRRWGTTQGLGEIAGNGPTANTKLDKVPLPLRFHPMTVVLSMDCDAAKWAPHLGA